MTHIAMQEALDGSYVTWMEHVTDAEYSAKVGSCRFAARSRCPSKGGAPGARTRRAREAAEPTARFMPLASVTLMLPASATRPDAVTAALFEATWPLLIPIETDAPLVQAAFDEVICTFQSPSNVAAADGVAKRQARQTAKRRSAISKLCS